MNFKTIIDLVNYFKDEKICQQYLAAKRWNGYMECPHKCGNDSAYVFADGIRYKCTTCRKIYTAKTGTFMEGTKLPTVKWIVAMYLILHKKGISSMQLSRDLGVTQKTSWFMLQRIREALGNEKEQQLSGIIEIDETFVGGKSRFKHRNKKIKYTPGRSWKDKTAVFGMLERGGKVKAMVVPDVTMLTLRNAVREHVEKGSSIMGDGYMAYRSLQHDYTVESVDHGNGWYGNAEIHTNSMEGFWSQFKKTWKGTYHFTSKKHLNKYVNESVFRYNYRNLDTQNQMECIIANMNVRLKYKDLVAKSA